MKVFFVIFASVFLAPLGLAQKANLEKLEVGKIIERVVCSKNSEESYALYVPSHYSPDRSWPVVFAFDPGARGKIPVELMRDAAERYGYIVLGSNKFEERRLENGIRGCRCNDAGCAIAI